MRRVEVAPGHEQEEPEVEHLEMVHHLADLLADHGGALLLIRVEEVRPGALDDRLQHGDRRDHAVAGERRDEDAEAVGVELNRAVGAHHLLGRHRRAPRRHARAEDTEGIQQAVVVADEVGQLVGEHEGERVVRPREVHEAARDHHEPPAERFADDLGRVEHVDLEHDPRPPARHADELLEDCAHADGGRVVVGQRAVLLALRSEDPARLGERQLALRLRSSDRRNGAARGEQQNREGTGPHGRFTSSVWTRSARSTSPTRRYA